MTPKSWTERIRDRIRVTGSALCVGLDPRPEQTPGQVEDFLRRAIEETAPYAAVYKPNLAYYEAMGLPGLHLLDRILHSGELPEEIPVLLDAKRSDIPTTQEAYAHACFECWGADAVTVNPLLGWDSIEPYFRVPGRGVYLLCLTSNPGARDFLFPQADNAQGPALFERIQSLAARAADMPGEAGLVAGLTQLTPDLAQRLHDLPLLVPGLGAQGGSLAALKAWGGSSPILVNASRSILYGEKSPGENARALSRDIARALSEAAPATPTD